MHEYSCMIAFPMENSNLNILGFLLFLLCNATEGTAMQSTREMQFSSSGKCRSYGDYQDKEKLNVET